MQYLPIYPIYICVYIHPIEREGICLDTDLYIYIIHMYSVCVYIYTYTCIHIHVYIYMYTYTCIYRMLTSEQSWT